MSKIITWKCNLCHQVLADNSCGVGLVFRSVRSGDFEVKHMKETDGTHICHPCAKTLARTLPVYLSETKN